MLVGFIIFTTRRMMDRIGLEIECCTGPHQANRLHSRKQQQQHFATVGRRERDSAYLPTLVTEPLSVLWYGTLRGWTTLLLLDSQSFFTALYREDLNLMYHETRPPMIVHCFIPLSSRLREP